MNITVITLQNSAYAIYVDGKKIIQCDSPISTFNTVIKSLNLVGKVEVHLADVLPNALGDEAYGKELKEVVVEETSDIDFDAINGTINFNAPKLGAYRKMLSDEPTEEIIETGTVDESVEEENPTYTPDFQPVGNVECPQLGDLVYVDGLDGFLAKIRGGVGTVGMVYDNTKAENCQQNILIELEEIPGHYFNWNELAGVQTDLKEKYGYKPACKIV